MCVCVCVPHGTRRHLYAHFPGHAQYACILSLHGAYKCAGMTVHLAPPMCVCERCFACVCARATRSVTLVVHACSVAVSVRNRQSLHARSGCGMAIATWPSHSPSQVSCVSDRQITSYAGAVRVGEEGTQQHNDDCSYSEDCTIKTGKPPASMQAPSHTACVRRAPVCACVCVDACMHVLESCVAQGCQCTQHTANRMSHVCMHTELSQAGQWALFARMQVCTLALALAMQTMNRSACSGQLT